MRASIFFLSLALGCGGGETTAGMGSAVPSGAPASSGPASASSVSAPSSAAPTTRSPSLGPSPSLAPSPSTSATTGVSLNAGSAAAPAAPVGAGAITSVAVRIGEIPATPHFDPHATLETLRPSLLSCYRRALEANPEIRGKVTLRIHLGESGAVLRVEAEPGGPANDPNLVGCIDGDFRANAHFPNPGGSAIVVAPLVFHSEAR